MRKIFLLLFLLLSLAGKTQKTSFIGFSYAYELAQQPEYFRLLDTINTLRDTAITNPFNHKQGGNGFGFYLGNHTKMLWWGFGLLRTLQHNTINARFTEHAAESRDYDIRSTHFSVNGELGFMPWKHFGICGTAGLSFQRFKTREGDAVAATSRDMSFQPLLGGLAIINLTFEDKPYAVQFRPYYKIAMADAGMKGISDYFLGAGNYKGPGKTGSTLIGVEFSIGIVSEN